MQNRNYYSINEIKCKFVDYIHEYCVKHEEDEIGLAACEIVSFIKYLEKKSEEEK